MRSSHDPNDPNYRREFEGEADEEGMTIAAWTGVAFVVMLLGGIAMYAFSNSNTTTVSSNQPGIEQSVPPATTGQGGAQSKMPAAKDKAQ